MNTMPRLRERQPTQQRYNLICAATCKNGQPCHYKASTNGVCGKHLSFIPLLSSAQTNPQQPIVQQSSPLAHTKCQNRKKTKDDVKVHGTFECAICLSSITNKMSKLSCEHCFHPKCINTWLDTPTGNQSCPMCRCLVRNKKTGITNVIVIPTINKNRNHNSMLATALHQVSDDLQQRLSARGIDGAIVMEEIMSIIQTSPKSNNRARNSKRKSSISVT